MYDTLILAVELVVSIPVFAYSFYTVALLAGSLAYRPLSPDEGEDEEEEEEEENQKSRPRISILIAVYNEENVIGDTLDSLAALNFPPSNLQVVIADDSTDSTIRIVDEKASALRARGINSVVSRRNDRSGFKAGALNLASRQIQGELVLLLDADSRVTTASLRRALYVLRRKNLSFISFRVGHYNRDENLVTRAFALFQDTIDGLQKMGSTRLMLPYSLQGGFVLATTAALREVRFWREGLLAEDADISCRLFSSGSRGAYVSEAELRSEDPSSLRVWKRQAARVAQGWAQCLRLDLLGILRSHRLGFWGKLGLLLTLLSPLASLTWIVVTILSAIAIVGGLIDPSTSVFGNPLYLGLVSLPVVVFYVAGAYALRIRRMLTWRNLLLLPVVSYMVSGMFTISAISFARGLVGAKAEFFRTPKSGSGRRATKNDSQPGEGLGVRVTEGGLSVFAVILSVPVFLRGQPFLGISLLGFGLVTLKSMDLFERRVLADPAATK